MEAADQNFVSPHRYLWYIHLIDRNYRGYLAEINRPICWRRSKI